ncbi:MULTISPECIES: Cu(I)-responsive transcriptional regulator [Limibacillus]|uniref:Cu(I)-responsive transcriptional regulator n=1 Tax=Limibacillus halophilus TaxID=1579333 RepID=A0A839SW34_9PROT|nr:Cu(I)-responsive transcriptional regulator [Limibacillus halophilus]MBB3065900.1 Cu(I)-responsive transcriptional regulator [Limibacillus halophilus]
MRIGEVSRRTGVPSKTIRYYEEIGLIDAASRTISGYRDYGHHELETLRFISRARGLGFTVAQVEDLLALWNDRDRNSAQVKQVAAEHLRRIDEKIAELRSIRGTLSHLMENCHGDDRPDCPILEGLEGKTSDA